MTEGESPEQAKGEHSITTERWDYDGRFKYYLYRVGVLGHEGVESINNFPARIELNDVWHNTLGKMKSESLDGRERWVPLGMKADRSLDFIPDQFIKGYFTEAKVLNKAEVVKEYGFAYHIGDIHTHPSDWFNNFSLKLILVTRQVKDYEGFSVPDLFRMVNGKKRLITGIVEKSHNHFAFRTAETKDLPADSPLLDRMAFSRHWYRKYGGIFLGKSHETFWASPRFSARAMNIGIAEAYNLALYKGRPGEELVREYPKIR